MPGAHHYAVARPFGPASGTQSVLLGLSENWQDGVGNKLFRWWLMEGCVYPQWFLQNRIYNVLNDGAYQPMQESFFQMPHQEIFIYMNYQKYATLFVHTPFIDLPGVFAIWESDRWGRDDAHMCTALDLTYRTHECYAGPTEHVKMRTELTRSRL